MAVRAEHAQRAVRYRAYRIPRRESAVDADAVANRNTGGIHRLTETP